MFRMPLRHSLLKTFGVALAALSFARMDHRLSKRTEMTARLSSAWPILRRPARSLVVYVGGNYAQRAIEHRTDERQFQEIRQRYQLLNPFPEIFLCLALLITHAGSYDTRRRYVDGSFAETSRHLYQAPWRSGCLQAVTTDSSALSALPHAILSPVPIPTNRRPGSDCRTRQRPSVRQRASGNHPAVTLTGRITSQRLSQHEAFDDFLAAFGGGVVTAIVYPPRVSRSAG